MKIHFEAQGDRSKTLFKFSVWVSSLGCFRALEYMFEETPAFSPSIVSFVIG